MALSCGAVEIVLASCELDLLSPSAVEFHGTGHSVERTQYETAWCVFSLDSLMGEMRPNVCEYSNMSWHHNEFDITLK